MKIDYSAVISGAARTENLANNIWDESSMADPNIENIIDFLDELAVIVKGMRSIIQDGYNELCEGDTAEELTVVHPIELNIQQLVGSLTINSESLEDSKTKMQATIMSALRDAVENVCDCLKGQQ